MSLVRCGQTAVAFTAIWLAGCAARHDIKFNAADCATSACPDSEHYTRVATDLEYPDLHQPCSPPEAIAPPIVLSTDHEPAYWNIRLEEAVHLALANNRVLRDLGGTVLRSPNGLRTTYEPALVDTDPRFGVEAALSEFDAVFSTRAFGEKTDRTFNNAILGQGANELTQDLFFFNSMIQKRAATGTLLTYRNNLDYEESNITSNQFFNTWNGNIETEVRQPLLQNAGVTYNRIAGPSGVPGQPNGVLIARVNTDISLADFEVGVRDLVSNVENAYWDLYFAYRDLDAKIAARNTALESWRKVYSFYMARRKGGEAFREAEAREQYFRFQEEVQNSLTGRLVEGTQTNNGSSGGSFRSTGGVHVAERRLRLLIGLPINDGQLLRPAEEPSLARVVFDWNEVQAEALVRRTELRRQKWIIKRAELVLLAARNYLKPQLDAVGLYRWRGFGDDLLSENDAPAEFDSALDNLFSGDNQEWQLGLEFSMPFGFRRGHAAVQNAQLLLARERAVLQEQERDVLLGLSNAVAEVDRAWGVAQTAFNRRRAARQQLSAVQVLYDTDKAALDLVLEAQRRLAESEVRYFAALSEYAIAVKNVHFEKGSLLDHNEILLAEGPWPGKAYKDALHRDGRGRPMWPLNYIFRRRGPVVADGQVPQDVQTPVALPPAEVPGEDVPPGVPSPLRSREGEGPSEPIPPGTLVPEMPNVVPSARYAPPAVDTVAAPQPLFAPPPLAAGGPNALDAGRGRPLPNSWPALSHVEGQPVVSEVERPRPLPIAATPNHSPQPYSVQQAGYIAPQR
jgi:outer membrane protein TolC